MKGLSPASLDMELRLLQIIDDEESEDLEQRPELQSISSLLDYFIHELSCRNNFEFVQAILKLFLKVCDIFILRAGLKVFSEAYVLEYIWDISIIGRLGLYPDSTIP